MIVACPVCGWVRPLHPHDEMRSCPCGWNLQAELLALHQTLEELAVPDKFATVTA